RLLLPRLRRNPRPALARRDLRRPDGPGARAATPARPADPDRRPGRARNPDRPRLQPDLGLGPGGRTLRVRLEPALRGAGAGDRPRSPAPLRDPVDGPPSDPAGIRGAHPR